MCQAVENKKMDIDAQSADRVPVDYLVGAEMLPQDVTDMTMPEFADKVHAAIFRSPQHSSEIVFAAIVKFTDLCKGENFAESIKSFAIWAGNVRDEVIASEAKSRGSLRAA
jgi:hypothetical protein